MIQKPGVRVRGVRPETVVGMMVVRPEFVETEAEMGAQLERIAEAVL